MKRIIATAWTALLILTFSVSLAEPSLVMNETTVWLGSDNHLFLTDSTGVVKELPSYIADIIGMDETNIYCTTNSGKLYGVRVDGSASSLIASAPTEDQLASYRKADAYTLADGTLTGTGADGKVTFILTDVVAFSSNQSDLWFVRKELTGSFSLNAMDIPSDSQNLAPIVRSMAIVNEPITITLTTDAVTLVDTQHAVQIYHFSDGSLQNYPAISDQTSRAAYVNGKLFRYVAEENGWKTESVEAPQQLLIQASITTPAPATPTPTPTIRPFTTATPTPTPRRVTPSPTPEEDETIRKWDKGSRVKKMQQRLADLGYPVGKIDGSYGEQTDIAVNLFQSSAGLTEHTYMTKKAQNRLYAANAPVYDQYMDLKKGDRGIRVRLMQEALKAKGYDPGKIDGIYGTNTITAVAAYQQYLSMQLEPGEIPGERASRWLLMNLYDEITPPVPIAEIETPEPIDPDSENPNPNDPDPESPEPVNPDPVNPDPEDPEPENPEPVNPDPESPTPVDPDPAEPDPASPTDL